jgi:hypothetical protein
VILFLDKITFSPVIKWMSLNSPYVDVSGVCHTWVS